MVRVAGAGGRAPLPPPPHDQMALPPPQPHDAYYPGEYYPGEQYAPMYMQQGAPPPEMQMGHTMCAMHSEYGGVTMVANSSAGAGGSPPLMPMMGGVGVSGHVMVDESGAVRHLLLSPHHHAHHTHHQHQHPHYGPANGGNGPPQPYYAPPGGYPPPHFQIPPPPHHVQHSPPPPHGPPPNAYQQRPDDRNQRQYNKPKKKFDQKHNRNNGLDLKSGASTPSPRRELSNGSASMSLVLRGNGASGGMGAGGMAASTSSEGEGEGSSAATSVHGGDDDDTAAILDMLSAARTPQVSDISSDSALVTWSTPITSSHLVSNSNLTYELLLGEEGRYKAIYTGSSLSCRVRDLRPGTEYTLCLQVRSGELTGLASSAATFRTPASAPAAPPAPRAVQRARTNVLLRWSTSPDNGSRVQYYLLECDTGNGNFVEIARPRTRQHTVVNLEPSTRYRFRLAAVNECGRGPYSEDAHAWTCGAPPPPPDAPALARASPHALVLTWPHRTGDEGYTLQMEDERSHHGFLPVYAGCETGHSCEGLDRSTFYKFRLRSHNDQGLSRWSDEVAYRTRPERPGPPIRLTARGKIHSRAFKVRWEPPIESGGAEVSSYILELDGGDGFKQAYAGLEREASCERLQPGTAYRIRVCCTTEGGNSEWSSIESVTTDAVQPGSCEAPALRSKMRSTTAPVCWQPPDYDGGAQITEYQLELTGSDEQTSTVYVGADTESTVQDLQPGRTYGLTVRAFNRIGGGPLSSILTFTTAPSPPDAPEAPTATVLSPFRALIEWKEPHDNGAPVLDYNLEMSVPDVEKKFKLIFHGSERVYDHKSLTPYTAYLFRVSATNMAGQGQWSATVNTTTPKAPPAAPTGLKCTSTATSLAFSWQEPSDHGSEILHYVVESGETTLKTEGPMTECCLEELLPETSYNLRVLAVNELGSGPVSSSLRVSTRPPPPPPPRLTCVQRFHNFLKLKWGDGKIVESMQYYVEMENTRTGEYHSVYRGTSYTCKVKKLTESTEYRFRAYAVGERSGRGDWSELVSFFTCASPPPPPRAPTCTILPSRSVILSWPALEVSTDDDPLTYIVQSCRTKEQLYRQVYSGPETSCPLGDLEAGCEYSVRACGARGALQGAWSTQTRFLAPPQSPACLVPAAQALRPRRARPLPPFTDRHWALLWLAGFMVVAVLAAVAVEQFINWQRAPHDI